jgi:hypothetical protein
VPLTEKRGELTIVKRPLSIFAFDWVIHPSHEKAYMESIISEQTMGMLLGAAEEFRGAPEPTVLREAEELFCDGRLLPLYEDQVRDYVEGASRLLRQAREQLEFGPESRAELSEDMRTVMVRCGGEAVRLFLEDYVCEAVDDFLGGLGR